MCPHLFYLVVKLLKFVAHGDNKSINGTSHHQSSVKSALLTVTCIHIETNETENYCCTFNNMLSEKMKNNKRIQNQYNKEQRMKI